MILKESIIKSLENIDKNLRLFNGYGIKALTEESLDFLVENIISNDLIEDSDLSESVKNNPAYEKINNEFDKKKSQLDINKSKQLSKLRLDKRVKIAKNPDKAPTIRKTYNNKMDNVRKKYDADLEKLRKWRKSQKDNLKNKQTDSNTTNTNSSNSKQKIPNNKTYKVQSK